jgi:hypothetical protein
MQEQISAGKTSLIREHGGTLKTCETYIGPVAPARDYGFIRMAGAVRSVFGAGERPTEGSAAPWGSGNTELTGGARNGYSSWRRKPGRRGTGCSSGFR